MQKRTRFVLKNEVIFFMFFNSYFGVFVLFAHFLFSNQIFPKAMRMKMTIKTPTQIIKFQKLFGFQVT